MADGQPGQDSDDSGLLPPPDAELPRTAPEAPPAVRDQPDAAAWGDLPSAAPVVGAVRRLPVPRLAPAARHRVAAVILDGVQVDDLHVSAASIIGTSHVVVGGVRQDAYNFVATTDGHLVIAIADGLGSRPLSQLGAALFGEGVAQAALDPPERPSRTAGELLARGAEYAAAAAEDFYRVPLADITFVAAVAVLGPAEPGAARVAEIARVGDVSAFAADPPGPLSELFATDDGPINMVSESLPGTAAPQPQTVRSQARMLALVTDGLANDLRTSPGIRSWLSERWGEPIGQFAFGDSLRYQRQGSHDDRTAVVVWQEAPADDGGGRQGSR